MNKAQAVKAAKSFFDNYPDVNSFHITANGKAFFEIGAARLHAKGLDDKTAITVNRNECDAKAPVKDEVKDEPVVMEETNDAADQVEELTPAAAELEETAKQMNKGRGRKK